MNQNNGTPYATLEPQLILDAIESVGLDCTGSLFALNSYENRVYQVGIEDAPPLIAKFYRPGRWSDAAIIEEHQFSLELAALEIPVVAPLILGAEKSLHHYQGFRFALFPRQSGRALELENLEQLEWIGRFIGRIHAASTSKSFSHRQQLTIDTYGHRPYQFLIENNFIPAALRENFCTATNSVLQKIELCLQEMGNITNIRLHGDCHLGNVLWNDTGPWIVDLDDCLMGPAVQDIWMLISGSKEEAALQTSRILRGYREFHDFNMRELRLIEALRALRMLRYSAWLAERWEDPAFPLNFPWFNTPHYWQQQIMDINEQSMLLDQDVEDTYFLF